MVSDAVYESKRLLIELNSLSRLGDIQLQYMGDYLKELDRYTRVVKDHLRASEERVNQAKNQMDENVKWLQESDTRLKDQLEAQQQEFAKTRERMWQDVLDTVIED